MGALQRTLPVKLWPLATCPWLHAGVIQLVLNLSSIIIVGHHLEQEFGQLRAAIIYLLSALVASVTSAVFVEHIPAVGSSGASFGLLGATFAGLIQNWKIYVAKFSALAMLGFVAVINFCIGLLQLADNFSSIGGFLSGILLGVVVLFNPRLSIMERKKGLFDYDLNKSVKLKQKLDKHILRIISLLMFVMILAGGLVAVIWGINANNYCSWCKYINCIPTEKWSCNERAPTCEVVFLWSVPRLLAKEEIGLIITIILLILLFQYLPKVYHSVCVLKRMQKATGYIFGTIWHFMSYVTQTAMFF